LPPPLIQLTTIQALLEWFRVNLSNRDFTDPRHYRVRFNFYDFIHFIKLTNKYAEEPKNRRAAVEDIQRGRIHFVAGRFDDQRASELSWASEVAANPDFICANWNPEGEGDECYVKNFGGAGLPNKYRVLVCLVQGTTRYAITIFPSEIGGKERGYQIWP